MEQLCLPWMVSEKTYRQNQSDYIRLRKLTLEQGFEYIRNPVPREIDGHLVEHPKIFKKGLSPRLRMFMDGQIKCVCCGTEGNHFYFERHKNDLVSTFKINLYGWKFDQEVMMTWDHIIPRSLGGSNTLANSQCMCEHCNRDKGNILPVQEMVEILKRDDILEMLKFNPDRVRGTIKYTIRDVLNEFSEMTNV